MDTKYLLLALSLFIFYNSATCLNGNGCSANATCDVEFVDNAVYGCSGGWKGSGIDNALCGAGYELCEDPDFAEKLGLTLDLCTDPNVIPTNMFFGSKAESDGSLFCDGEGENDVFGCASATDDGWLYILDSLNDTIECGPFGAALTSDTVGNGGAKYGWKLDTNSANRERNAVNHNMSTGGGVLCCKQSYHSYCQSESAANCAHCAAYSPCLNSVDPHCITHKALDCLSCANYTVCAACAPGWDIGCISKEDHKNESCDAPDIKRPDNESIAVEIAYLANGECYQHPVWGFVGRIDCTTGDAFIGGTVEYYDAGQYFLANTSTLVCNATEHMASTPTELFDVNASSEAEQQCFVTTENTDENRSANVWGICGLEAMPCPSGHHCGPAPCNMDTEDYCIEIEIFDKDTTCLAVDGAGDYKAYVIADNVCRMDGSGRSYYALQCANNSVYGVIGCASCDCTTGCTDIGIISPNTCYQDDWLNDLQIAGLMDEEKAMCNQTRTEIQIDASICSLTDNPTTSQPTFFPTSYPTNEPTMVPTKIPTNIMSTTEIIIHASDTIHTTEHEKPGGDTGDVQWLNRKYVYVIVILVVVAIDFV